MSKQLTYKIAEMLNDMMWEIHDNGRAKGKTTRTQDVRFNTMLEIRNKILNTDWEKASSHPKLTLNESKNGE